MKSAFVISGVAIALAGLALWQQSVLGGLRSEHASLMERSRHITSVEIQAAGTKAGRHRSDPLVEARKLADDLIHRAAAGGVYQSDWAVQAALAERVRRLNPTQLRVLIDALHGAESISPELRQKLVFHFLGRLAEDFPREVLEWLETNVHDESRSHRFSEVFSKAVAGFAERDPEGAWQWYEDMDFVANDPATRQISFVLLSGIARSDPALALRRAEETGIEGTSFLRHGKRTIDQRLAALAALRSWSRDDPARQSELGKHIRDETLKPAYPDPNRFDEVTNWIKQAALPLDEIAFLADPSALDLCYYIDPQETGQWIEWLCREFPEGRIEGRLQRIFEDHRTKDEARAWLESLPPDEAESFKRRLSDG